jgi:dihydropteroate synthase
VRRIEKLPLAGETKKFGYVLREGNVMNKENLCRGIGQSQSMIKIGNVSFDIEHHTYVMGILNVTPDSFSDGGTHNTLELALEHTQKMMEDGAHLIDVGGESTRPGYTMISDQEEIERTAPVIEAIKARFDVPVSIDTYKSGVAKAAVAAGADMVNDIWGLKYDPEMANVIAQTKTACCLMHNRKEAVYKNFRTDILDDLQQTLELAKNAGIKEEQIVLDPGVGFGKTYEQNLEVLRYLDDFKKWGLPVLLGTSRKSVIGNTLNLPTDERVEGTLVTTVFAVTSGCAFVRVHDVKENARAIRMAEAIVGSWIQ